MNAFLVDTNILVYRFDPRDEGKQATATKILRKGLEDGLARVPHQAIIEFVAATTRPLGGGPGDGSLLTEDQACQEAEELVRQFPILHPTDAVLRTALQGWRTYRLSWFDAHLWAYAEHYGLSTLCSEDFQPGRLYGGVRVWNPFVE